MYSYDDSIGAIKGESRPIKACGRHGSALAGSVSPQKLRRHLPEHERLPTSLTVLELLWSCLNSAGPGRRLINRRFRLECEAPIATETATAYV
jgi:hypothetical protein